MSNITQQANAVLNAKDRGKTSAIFNIIERSIDYEYVMGDETERKRFWIRLYLALYDEFADKDDALYWLLECVVDCFKEEVKTLIANFEKLLDKNE